MTTSFFSFRFFFIAIDQFQTTNSNPKAGRTTQKKMTKRKNRGGYRTQSGRGRGNWSTKVSTCAFVASFLRRSTSRHPRKPFSLLAFFSLLLRRRIFFFFLFFLFFLFFFFFSFAREDRIEEKNVFIFVVRSISSKRVKNGRKRERGSALRRRRQRRPGLFSNGKKKRAKKSLCSFKLLHKIKCQKCDL